MYKYFSTNQFKNVIKAVHERANYHQVEVPTLRFVGTVKLHGTNSSVYSRLSDGTFVAQSKNNTITPEQDNHGFATFAYGNKSEFDKIFQNIKTSHPECIADKTAVIYGEWCGGSIQNGVALAKLDKMFVVFAIKLSDNEKNPDVADIWLDKDQIAKSLEGTQKIHNIYHFKTYEVEIDMYNPKLSQNTLIDITNAVEKECPVGAAFGVSGVGEGVVWRCVTPHPQIETGDLIFKVKGAEHSVSHVKTIAPVDVEKVNSINQFVESVVTENRLNQGLDYLREQQLSIDKKYMGVFLKWMADDCLREEADVIEASHLEKKEVTTGINQVAKKWFFERINDEQKNKFKM